MHCRFGFGGDLAGAGNGPVLPVSDRLRLVPGDWLSGARTEGSPGQARLAPVGILCINLQIDPCHRPCGQGTGFGTACTAGGCRRGPPGQEGFRRLI